MVSLCPLVDLSGAGDIISLAEKAWSLDDGDWGCFCHCNLFYIEYLYRTKANALEFLLCLGILATTVRIGEAFGETVESCDSFIAYNYCYFHGYLAGFASRVLCFLRYSWRWGLIFPVSVLLAFAAYPQLSKVNGFGNYFRKLGKDSLVIYLLHAPIVSVTRIVLLKLGIDNVFIHVINGLLAGWYGSLSAVYLMTKLPYIDFLFYPKEYVRTK